MTVFSPFDDTVMTGVVTSINTAKREVKLFRGEDDFAGGYYIDKFLKSLAYVMRPYIIKVD
ncbi:hypothetical protein [Paenibacillus sp. Mc5Re-14]|uniref:hypothetical protein n=1 Tax=Paenibacillus sp. Mc5Re-14 TaxID=1030529 RepID=UPI0020FFF90A|nr:hypothetical protein [Paenibacillus sp. Mc5Re-14]